MPSSLSQPLSLRPLCRDNPLITPAGDSERPAETVAEIGSGWAVGGGHRLWPIATNRDTQFNAPFMSTRLSLRKPLRNLRVGAGQKRQRRPSLSGGVHREPWADRVCNRPGNSGGRIRTCDLRVMSPTSYQTALPRSHYPSFELSILDVSPKLDNPQTPKPPRVLPPTLHDPHEPQPHEFSPPTLHDRESNLR